MNEATQPIGGYVTATAIALFLALLPIASVKTALSGDYAAAVLLLVIGLPMFYYFAKYSVKMNEEVRDYRSWLRTSHGWLFPPV